MVVDKDEDRVEGAMKVGMLSVAADACNDDALRDVGIAKASGLIATLGSDADNLFLTLSAKSLNSRLRLAARVDEEAPNKRCAAQARTSYSPPTTAPVIGWRRPCSSRTSKSSSISPRRARV